MKDIVLIGAKHSGKTSVGKALASLCSCDFVDLDELISQRAGKTPRQLFSESPEVFKKAEAEAMTHFVRSDFARSDFARSDFARSDFARSDFAGTCDAGGRIVAAGGGIIDNPSALDILVNSGAITVCLNISADSAWDRIANSADGELPPFLKTENPRETHRALHERRTAAYLQMANIVIEAEGKTPEEIAGEIYKQKCMP